MQYDGVLECFQCIVPVSISTLPSLKEKVTILLSTIFDCVEKMVGGKMLYPYALGKTKVYFRVGSLEVLESDRFKMYTKHASFIQSCVRCNLTMMNFKELRKPVTLLR